MRLQLCSPTQGSRDRIAEVLHREHCNGADIYGLHRQVRGIYKGEGLSRLSKTSIHSPSHPHKMFFTISIFASGLIEPPGFKPRAAAASIKLFWAVNILLPSIHRMYRYSDRYKSIYFKIAWVL